MLPERSSTMATWVTPPRPAAFFPAPPAAFRSGFLVAGFCAGCLFLAGLASPCSFLLAFIFGLPWSFPLPTILTRAWDRF
jgi:hypothetical protein